MAPTIWPKRLKMQIPTTPTSTALWTTELWEFAFTAFPCMLQHAYLPSYSTSSLVES